MQDVSLTYSINGGDSVKIFAQDDGTCLTEWAPNQKLLLQLESLEFGYSELELTTPDQPSLLRVAWAGGEVQAKLTPLGGLTRGLPGGLATVVGGSDSCASPDAISGEGSFTFDNTFATMDGLDHAACDFFGSQSIDSDVWFAWTAPCDGDVNVDTCGSSVDTKVAVYNNVACPPGDADLLACNDDFCGLQSQVTFAATNGATYLIRLGTFPGAAGGSGTFNIECSTAGPVSCATGVGCQIPDQQGHGGSGTLAATSDLNPNAGFLVADGFRPTASGSISSVCWWGVYIDFGLFADCGPGTGDKFSITYFNDDNGSIPGSLHAGPFSVNLDNKFSTGNFLVAGSLAVAEYQFEATHPPVSVTAGQGYWVEITNDTLGTCFWLWSTAPGGDDRGAQDAGTGYAFTDYDLAFCVDIATDPAGLGQPGGPGNDDCANATAISGEGTFPFDNLFATSVGPDHLACDFFGFQTIDNDVWYCWTADCDATVRVETCGLTGVDTKIAVYDGCACPPTDADLLACNDDDCGLQSGLEFTAVAGNTYLIRVGTFAGASGGSGSFLVDCLPPPATNDLCEDAIPVAVPSLTPGTTESATIDTNAPLCVTSVTSPGVWYTVTGTGNRMTASLCNGVATYDTKLSVYCGDCPDGLTCVVGIDDFCGLQSEVSWCSQQTAVYYVLVHGFGGQAGPFELEIFDDGTPCTATVACLPIGACCFGKDCEQTTEFDCNLRGGVYLGDDISCGGGDYALGGSGSAFEDISGSGTQLVLGDDQGQTVALGFTFQFFGSSKTNVSVCSNGYLTFGSDLTDFSNDPIPNATDPNDLIAVLWDDLNPSSGGTVHYEVRGAAPNRRFIAQWTNVPQFANTDMNTFQAVLFEGSNNVELRYGNFTPQAFAGDYTAGIENATGTAGIGLDTSTLAPGDSHLIELVVQPSPCPIPVDVDLRTHKCPNEISQNSDSYIKTTIAGSADFDPTQVDPATLRISRTDGVGTFVSSVEGGPVTSRIDDLIGPSNNGVDCECVVTLWDGIDDLVCWFYAPTMLVDLNLAALPVGQVVEFQISGQYFDGTKFEGLDCAKIIDPFPGNPDPNNPRLTVSSNAPNLFVEVSPHDNSSDADGAGTFSRIYPKGTQVILQTQIQYQGRPLAGWKVNRQFIPGARSRLVITLDRSTMVEVVYHDYGMATDR